MDISYKEIYMLNREVARRQVVNSYLASGNMSQVARLWHTSRNLVRKWVKRFEENGEEGQHIYVSGASEFAYQIVDQLDVNLARRIFLGKCPACPN